MILEGPELTGEKTRLKFGTLPGWRYYQFVSKGKVTTCIGHPNRMNATAAATGAAFYPAGSWENAAVNVPENTMATPRPEILAEIWPRNEWQDQLSFVPVDK